MPCQTQTSQQPQQPTTVLPQNLPQTQADWQRFLQRMNELLGSINNAQYATGVNAVPTEYAVYDGTALPSLRITGATSAFDTSHVQFGAGSLQLTATASTVTVELAASGYPITLHPNWKWIASLFLLTSASTIAGKLSVVTPAKQYDVDISGAPGASWSRLYGDYDLTADDSTSCTLLLTLTGVTVGQVFNLEGWMLEPSQGAVLPSPFIMTSGPRILDQLPDGLVYSKPLGSELENGAIPPPNVGDNICPNPSFELNAAGLSLGTGVRSGLVCDGWVVGENSSGSGTCTVVTDGNPGRTHGGSNRLQLQLPSGVSIPNGGNLFVGAWTAKKIAVTAGDVFYVSAYIFNDRGTTPPSGITTQTRVFLRYYDANNNYLSQAGIVDSSSGGTMATPLTGTSTVPSTASYARVYCQLLFANSSGSAVSSVNGWFISNIDDIIVNKQVALEVAGSARQIGDQRNLPAITFSNYGSGWNGMSLSYTSTTTSATVTASAATLQAGSVSISYNAASTTVTGSAGTTKTYYLYYTDATHSGGSQTLHAATSIITALNNDGNVYIASMSVTFPSSGSGGGSGAGGCPLRTAWVIRRGRHGRPQYVRAGKVRVGDWLLRSDGEWAEVTFSRPELQPGVRIVADGFGTLGCSISAPMQTPDGSVVARDCLGRELVVQGGRVTVTDLRGLGDQWVQHITLSNAPDDFYLVGDAKTALFAHHNMKPP